ncbi:MAG: DNA-protecting protein DprA [Acidobacteria bacterium]|nr:DNA-protecting protein DprA [Acidobacteriota bacterium]
MPQDLERYSYWLAVLLTPGVGARLAAELLRRFGSPEKIFSASRPELEACGLPGPVAQTVVSRAPLKAAEQELEKVRQLGVQLLAWDEPDYPPLLKQIYDPPVLLYLRGDPAVLSSHGLGIVGSRQPTPYGTQVTERLAEELAGRGLTVVSGLARGIDSAAHRGALKVPGGKTIAVLGCGIDVDYPKENRKLRAQIEANGCLATELPIGIFPAPQNFPVRNRIIAGLSWGVMVVEGGRYSGSLITGRLAMEYNRQVYGVPGNITNPKSNAPNSLIKQGAKLVETWEDVVEELPTPVRSEILERLAATTVAAPAQKALPLEENLSATARAVFGILKVDEALHVDQVVESTELASSDVLAALFELEMKGLIRQLPGKFFLRVLPAGVGSRTA